MRRGRTGFVLRLVADPSKLLSLQMVKTKLFCVVRYGIFYAFENENEGSKTQKEAFCISGCSAQVTNEAKMQFQVVNPDGKAYYVSALALLLPI